MASNRLLFLVVGLALLMASVAAQQQQLSTCCNRETTARCCGDAGSCCGASCSVSRCTQARQEDAMTEAPAAAVTSEDAAPGPAMIGSGLMCKQGNKVVPLHMCCPTAPATASG